MIGAKVLPLAEFLLLIGVVYLLLMVGWLVVYCLCMRWKGCTCRDGLLWENCPVHGETERRER
ncbi:MAG: hypothetical protein ACE5G0_14975 [Rhodothermales bacterium]